MPQIKISNPSTEHPTTDYFNASSATYFGPYFKINKGDDNSHKVVNVLDSSDDEEEGSSNLQLHYLDKRNPMWSLFLDVPRMTKEDIFKLTSPYQSITKDASTTIQALVNLKKSSIKFVLSELASVPETNEDGLNSLTSPFPTNSIFRLQFSYDSSAECLIRVYINVKEVAVVDLKSKSPYKGNKSIILRTNDNLAPRCLKYGPFTAGLNQEFTTEELSTKELYQRPEFPSEAGIKENISRERTISGSSTDSSTDGSSYDSEEEQDEEDTDKEDGKPENVVSDRVLPYSFVVVIETVVPALSEGMDKAARQGIVNPIHSQTSYISLNSTSKDAKVVKQKITIDGNTYDLEEIYGFIDESSNEQSIPTHDCVICMCESRDTIVLPCRHLCICRDCAEVLRLRREENEEPSSPTAANNDTSPTSGSPTNFLSNPFSSITQNAVSVFTSLMTGSYDPPEMPLQSQWDPPKCPLCRQDAHSFLQINLPGN